VTDLHVHFLLPPPSPSFVHGWREKRVRVNEKIRKSVVFVGYESSRGFVPYGTGFFCTLPDPNDSGFCWDFIATAQHVLNKIPNKDVSIRVNRHDGDCRIIKCEYDIFLSRPEVDIALMPFALGTDVYDFLCLPLNREEAKKTFGFWEPGIGDEVCISGLYTSHYGATKNVPIIRVGHLAAMPDELVQTDIGYVEGFLIEVHSIAGLSGSPVFVTPPTLYWDEAKKQTMQLQENAHVPIGMLLGHHVIETKGDEIFVPGFQSAVAGEPPPPNQKNTGIGVVVPMERFYEMVESETMQKSISASLDTQRTRGGFRPDSATPAPPTKDGDSQHKERFNRLLNAAVKSPKSGGRT
jgi:hypothetical protein